MNGPLDLAEQRKVIQLVVTNGGETQPNVIYALCDDGTIWWKPELDKTKTWVRELDIPPMKATNVRY